MTVFDSGLVLTLLMYVLQDPPPATKAHAVNRKPMGKSPLHMQSLKRGLKGGTGLSPAAVDLFGNTDPYAFGF
jgi:hypothetical protein